MIGQKGQTFNSRDARFLFLAAQPVREDDDEPPPGAAADASIRISFSGFTECAARLAREGASEDDLLEKAFPDVLQDYLLKVFLPATVGLGFWELKKTAVIFKRKTKTQADAKAGLAPPTAKLGLDVEQLLSEQSAVRTSMFSALANYKLDPPSQQLVVSYLKTMGLHPQVSRLPSSAFLLPRLCMC